MKSNKKSGIIGATSLGILSSVLSFIGVVSCCGLPLIAGALAWLGIGASQISFLAEYRLVFIGIAILALLFGFWQVYFHKASSCCSASCCDTETANQDMRKSKSALFQKIFLWIGAVVIILMLIWGSQNQQSYSVQDNIDIRQVQLEGEQSGCCSTESELVEEEQPTNCCQ